MAKYEPDTRTRASQMLTLATAGVIATSALGVAAVVTHNAGATHTATSTSTTQTGTGTPSATTATGSNVSSSTGTTHATTGGS